ncbi:MAG: DUF2479 domain-containing protein [Lachnospiraceae bacterium]|nr:DUF2479 domain-containing protein [Lachnospiraceae bacterium]
MNIIRHIKVDLYGDVKRYAVAAKQLDMATRYVGVTLTVDGVEWEIPKDVEIAVAMRKPDEKRVWNDCTRQKNEALIPLTRQMLAVQGTALCDVELYQNGALLSSASFELEIYPSQRVDETIISSEEYTRLENAIYAAREALQMAQETSERINAAEAIREAAEAVRVAQEKAREIKESQREDRTAAAVKDCIEATQDAIEKTAACVKATEAARKVVIDMSGLNAILNEVKDYYERIRALETDINITIDGGTAKSREFLLIDGGTAFSTDYDKYNAGRAHTI